MTNGPRGAEQVASLSFTWLSMERGSPAAPHWTGRAATVDHYLVPREELGSR